MTIQDDVALPRYITLAEVERRTGISANAIRQRKFRGKAMPFPVYKFGEMRDLHVCEDDLRAYFVQLKPVTK